MAYHAIPQLSTVVHVPCKQYPCMCNAYAHMGGKCMWVTVNMQKVKVCPMGASTCQELSAQCRTPGACAGVYSHI